MEDSEFAVIFCTCPNQEAGEKIAQFLLEEKRVACVNLLTGLKSFYWWKGKIEKEPEVLLLIKTRLDLFPQIQTAIENLHPYETPEIIALPIKKGNKSYLQWIRDSLPV